MFNLELFTGLEAGKGALVGDLLHFAFVAIKAVRFTDADFWIWVGIIVGIGLSLWAIVRLFRRA